VIQEQLWRVQVFFPIGFWSYKPSLIYDRPPYPADIDISAKSGYFDSERVDHASFYSADYVAARRKLATASAAAADLFDLFVVYHSGIHILHAVEPALQLLYRDTACKLSTDICPPHRIPASHEQLALLVLEHQQNASKP